MIGVKETHVSEEKKLRVKELAEQMKRNTVIILSIKSLPSAQFQDIKKKLRSKAKIQVAKKSLIDFALDHSGIKELHALVPYVEDNTAILFSDIDAFEISRILSEEKSPAKAKAGQIALKDIGIKAGPTELLPGPDISALSSVGLIPKVEKGKISIMNDKIILKEGGIITPELASIMAKLDIVPFEVGIEPIAAYMNGKVYVDIKIDKQETLEELEKMFGQALAFSIDISYVNEDTLDYIFGRAGIEEKVIESLIGEGKKEKESEEIVEEVKPEEIKKEEDEDNADSIKGASETKPKGESE